jgi:hypothetical protein
MLRFSKSAFAPFSATIGTSGNRNSSVPARHATGLRRHGLLTSDDPATAGRAAASAFRAIGLRHWVSAGVARPGCRIVREGLCPT